MRTHVAVVFVVLAGCSQTPPVGGDCSAGLDRCGTACVDLTRSSTDCGACGNACATGQSCVAQACYADTCPATPCSAVQVCKQDACAERACIGVVCPAGTTCLGGVCLSSGCAGRLCPDKFVCLSGQCTDTSCIGVICAGGQVCSLGVCGADRCADGVKDGAETDVDCGGPECARRCSETSVCQAAADCASSLCTAGRCVAPTCSDGVRNGSESDADCGGTCPNKCSPGKSCGSSADCSEHLCSTGVCASPSCGDGVANGNETDVDCGGSCPNNCGAGQACGTAADCATPPCGNGRCGPSCFDGVKDGTEADIDCGGSCARKCADGQVCANGPDCASGVCSTLRCASDPLLTGLAGHWTMNGADLAGNTMIDASGQGNHANLIGGGASTAGAIGEALLLNGSQRLYVGNVLNFSATLTMSGWARVPAAGVNQFLIRRWCNIGCSNALQSYELFVDVGGHAVCAVNGLDGSDLAITGVTLVNNGQWHLLTCTIDKFAPLNNMVLYVDGNIDAMATVGNNVIARTEDPLWLGDTFYGSLDDVRIYGRALTAPEVFNLKNATNPGVSAAPTALTATANSSFETALTWTQSSSTGVGGYVVERSENGTSGWFPVGVVGPATSSFADTSLYAGHTSYYRLAAQSPWGRSSPSATASATTADGGFSYSTPSGLLAYWTGNAADILSGQLRDATGNFNPANLVGSPTPLPGKIGDALSFSGTNYLQVSSSNTSPTQALTLNVWVNTTAGITGSFMDKWCVTGCSDSLQAYELGMSAAGVPYCSINGLNSGDLYVPALTPINDGNWHMVTCTGDALGPGNNMKVFVDGVLENSAAVGTNLVATTSEPLRLGSGFVGLLDDWRLYSRALSLSEIHALYANGKIGAP